MKHPFKKSYPYKAAWTRGLSLRLQALLDWPRLRRGLSFRRQTPPLRLKDRAPSEILGGSLWMKRLKAL